MGHNPLTTTGANDIVQAIASDKSQVRLLDVMVICSPCLILFKIKIRVMFPTHSSFRSWTRRCRSYAVLRSKTPFNHKKSL